MKVNWFFLICLIFIFLWSCGLDNYDEPKSTLTGEILFEGEPVRVKGTGEAIQLQLYQDGYDLDASIPLYVKQDGKFEALLFDGTYKLVTRDKNGPWENTRDTLFVSVKGDTHVEVEVTPYFIISDVVIEQSGTILTGSFKVDKILDEAEVDYVMLLLNSTTFVDDTRYLLRLDGREIDIDNRVELSMDVSDNKQIQKKDDLFARIGVRAAGADQAIYSDIIRLK